MNRLDEIEARANAATPGPWEVDPFTWKPGHPIPPSEWLGIEATGPVKGEVARIQPNDGEGHANAEFIAHGPTDVSALVAAFRAVLALHIQMPSPFYTHDICAHPQCKSTHDSEEQSWWPCPTVKAIYNSLGESIPLK